MDWFTQPWPWYVAGPLIAISMFLLLVSGRRLGISSNFQTMCAIGGAKKISDYFHLNWHERKWNLAFAFGTIIGGGVSHFLMRPDATVEISPKTTEVITSWGLSAPDGLFTLPELFGPQVWSDPKMLAILLIGGVLVGFGTRYADGCTSGHAISGLSALQLPSLIAVIGFFVGGLTATHFLLPHLF